MSIDSFGVFNTLNALIMILVSVSGVISFTVAKYINENKHDTLIISKYIVSLFYYISFIMLIIYVITILLINDIKLLFNINDTVSFHFVVLITYSSAILAIALGILQGFLLHIKNTIKNFLYSFVRLLLGIVLIVLLGYSYNGALFATLLAHIIIIATTFYVVYQKTELRFDIFNFKFNIEFIKDTLIYMLPIALTWTNIAFLSNIDIILVNKIFFAEIAGAYSAASIIGKIAFFLPSGLIFVFYPELLNNTNSKKSFYMFLSFLLLTILLSGVFTLMLYFYPELLITFFFGERYLESSNVLFLIAIFMTLVAVLNIVSYYLLARKNYIYLYGTLPIYIIAIFIFGVNYPNDYIQLVLNLISILLIFVIYYIYCILNDFRKINAS